MCRRRGEPETNAASVVVGERGTRNEMDNQDTREWTWSLQIPGAIQIVVVLFIAVSLYFGSPPIFARLGGLLGYAYWIVGIVLILVMTVSFGFSIKRNGLPRAEKL